MAEFPTIDLTGRYGSTGSLQARSPGTSREVTPGKFEGQKTPPQALAIPAELTWDLRRMLDVFSVSLSLAHSGPSEATETEKYQKLAQRENGKITADSLRGVAHELWIDEQRLAALTQCLSDKTVSEEVWKKEAGDGKRARKILDFLMTMVAAMHSECLSLHAAFNEALTAPWAVSAEGEVAPLAGESQRSCDEDARSFKSQQNSKNLTLEQLSSFTRERLHIITGDEELTLLHDYMKDSEHSGDISKRSWLGAFRLAHSKMLSAGEKLAWHLACKGMSARKGFSELLAEDESGVVSREKLMQSAAMREMELTWAELWALVSALSDPNQQQEVSHTRWSCLLDSVLPLPAVEVQDMGTELHVGQDEVWCAVEKEEPNVAWMRMGRRQKAAVDVIAVSEIAARNLKYKASKLSISSGEQSQLSKSSGEQENFAIVLGEADKSSDAAADAHAFKFEVCFDEEEGEREGERDTHTFKFGGWFEEIGKVVGEWMTPKGDKYELSFLCLGSLDDKAGQSAPPHGASRHAEADKVAPAHIWRRNIAKFHESDVTFCEMYNDAGMFLPRAPSQNSEPKSEVRYRSAMRDCSFFEMRVLADGFGGSIGITPIDGAAEPIDGAAEHIDGAASVKPGSRAADSPLSLTVGEMPQSLERDQSSQLAIPCAPTDVMGCGVVSVPEVGEGEPGFILYWTRNGELVKASYVSGDPAAFEPSLRMWSLRSRVVMIANAQPPCSVVSLLLSACPSPVSVRGIASGHTNTPTREDWKTQMKAWAEAMCVEGVIRRRLFDKQREQAAVAEPPELEKKPEQLQLQQHQLKTFRRIAADLAEWRLHDCDPKVAAKEDRSLTDKTEGQSDGQLASGAEQDQVNRRLDMGAEGADGNTRAELKTLVDVSKEMGRSGLFSSSEIAAFLERVADPHNGEQLCALRWKFAMDMGSREMLMRQSRDANKSGMVLASIVCFHGMSAAEAYTQLTDPDISKLVDHLRDLKLTPASLVALQRRLKGHRRPAVVSRTRWEGLFRAAARLLALDDNQTNQLLPSSTGSSTQRPDRTTTGSEDKDKQSTSGHGLKLAGERRRLLKTFVSKRDKQGSDQKQQLKMGPRDISRALSRMGITKHKAMNRSSDSMRGQQPDQTEWGIWEFESAVEANRIATTLRKHDLDSMLAQKLMRHKPGLGTQRGSVQEIMSSEDLLSWLVRLDSNKQDVLLEQVYLEAKADTIKAMKACISMFKVQGKGRTKENKSKYAVDLEELKTAAFGTLDDFNRGLDTFIGMPSPNVEIAIRNEHLHDDQSRQEFTAKNTNISTTPEREYHLVMSDASSYSDGRRGGSISFYLGRKQATRAGLTRAEVLALRLFTGPMYGADASVMFEMRSDSMRTFGAALDQGGCRYQEYNKVLRNVAFTRITTGPKRYVTTIHAIVSAVVKLSKCWPLPRDRKVYRGLNGVELPDKFWKEDDCQCKGGVEFGLMSTTTSLDVAMQYSMGVQPIVFEIDVGQVDRGAELSWISQYKGEKEVLMPPLSNLEVVGNPYLKYTDDKDDPVQVLMVPLRVNVNLKSRTIEELIATRKMVFMTALSDLQAEVRREVFDIAQAKEEMTRYEGRLTLGDQGETEWFNDHLSRAELNLFKDRPMEQPEVGATHCNKDQEFRSLIQRKTTCHIEHEEVRRLCGSTDAEEWTLLFQHLNGVDDLSSLQDQLRKQDDRRPADWQKRAIKMTEHIVSPKTPQQPPSKDSHQHSVSTEDAWRRFSSPAEARSIPKKMHELKRQRSLKESDTFGKQPQESDLLMRGLGSKEALAATMAEKAQKMILEIIESRKQGSTESEDEHKPEINQSWQLFLQSNLSLLDEQNPANFLHNAKRVLMSLKMLSVSGELRRLIRNMEGKPAIDSPQFDRRFRSVMHCLELACQHLPLTTRWDGTLWEASESSTSKGSGSDSKPTREQWEQCRDQLEDLQGWTEELRREMRKERGIGHEREAGDDTNPSRRSVGRCLLLMDLDDTNCGVAAPVKLDSVSDLWEARMLALLACRADVLEYDSEGGLKHLSLSEIASGEKIVVRLQRPVPEKLSAFLPFFVAASAPNDVKVILQGNEQDASEGTANSGKEAAKATAGGDRSEHVRTETLMLRPGGGLGSMVRANDEGQVVLNLSAKSVSVEQLRMLVEVARSDEEVRRNTVNGNDDCHARTTAKTDSQESDGDDAHTTRTAALRLERIQMERNSLGTKGAEDGQESSLKLLGDLIAVSTRDLKWLQLSDNKIEAKMAKELFQSFERDTVPSLTRLELSNNKLGDDGLTSLARTIGKGKLCSLHTLRVAKNDIGFHGVKELATVLPLVTVKRCVLGALDLSENRIGSEGLVALCARTSKCPSLTELDVSCNQICDVGMRQVLSWQNSEHAEHALMHLNKLFLSENYLTEDGAQALLNAIQEEKNKIKIEFLSLNHNMISNDGLKKIAQCLGGVLSVPEKLLRFNIEKQRSIATGTEQLEPRNRHSLILSAKYDKVASQPEGRIAARELHIAAETHKKELAQALNDFADEFAKIEFHEQHTAENKLCELDKAEKNLCELAKGLEFNKDQQQFVAKAIKFISEAEKSQEALDAEASARSALKRQWLAAGRQPQTLNRQHLKAEHGKAVSSFAEFSREKEAVWPTWFLVNTNYITALQEALSEKQSCIEKVRQDFVNNVVTGHLDSKPGAKEEAINRASSALSPKASIAKLDWLCALTAAHSARNETDESAIEMDESAFSLGAFHTRVLLDIDSELPSGLRGLRLLRVTEIANESPIGVSESRQDYEHNFIPWCGLPTEKPPDQVIVRAENQSFSRTYQAEVVDAAAQTKQWSEGKHGSELLEETREVLRQQIEVVDANEVELLRQHYTAQKEQWEKISSGPAAGSAAQVTKAAIRQCEHRLADLQGSSVRFFRTVSQLDGPHGSAEGDVWAAAKQTVNRCKLLHPLCVSLHARIRLALRGLDSPRLPASMLAQPQCSRRLRAAVWTLDRACRCLPIQKGSSLRYYELHRRIADAVHRCHCATQQWLLMPLEEEGNFDFSLEEGTTEERTVGPTSSSQPGKGQGTAATTSTAAGKGQGTTAATSGSSDRLVDSSNFDFSLQRCLALFNAGNWGSIRPSTQQEQSLLPVESASAWLDLAATINNVWEARLLASLCIGPKAVGNIKVEQIVTGATIRVQYRIRDTAGGGASRSSTAQKKCAAAEKHIEKWTYEVAFLAHLVATCGSGKVEVVFEDGERKGKIVLVPGGGVDHYVRMSRWEDRHYEQSDAEDSDGEDSLAEQRSEEEFGVLSLQKMDLCKETLRLLAEAAVAKQDTGCVCEAKEGTAGKGPRRPRIPKTIEIGQNPRLGRQGAAAMKLVVQLSLLTAGDSLRELHMNCSAINDEGVAELCKHATEKRFGNHLELLLLSDNEISDDGAQELAKVVRDEEVLPKLTTLCLAGNRLQDAGKTALREAFRAKRPKALQRRFGQLEQEALSKDAAAIASRLSGLGL